MKSEVNTPLTGHPCFNKEASHMYARVHLPVAPGCNIQCNYCNRKYDCVNESRPGVTSAVLSPHQALAYLKELHKHMQKIAVIGIAGPGDPFANPEETMITLELAGDEFPDKIFCLSTNGLNVIPYIADLKALRVTHVTLTINAVDPGIGKNIYSWIRANKKVYRGEEAASILLEEQLTAIVLLKRKGIIVKINSIILPGINDNHFAEIARKVKSLGADIMNCIPVFPNAGTVFSDIKTPDVHTVNAARNAASDHISLMTHCARCRADAAGLLGKDFDGRFNMISEFASKPMMPEEDRAFVAVCTEEGQLVNLHMGESARVNIYAKSPNGFRFIEERTTPDAGTGDFRWMQLAAVLKDCRALLTSGIGNNPLKILQQSGIRVIQMTGLIDEGLDAIYNNKPLRTVSKAEMFKCGSSCKGNAQGCA
jgi:nitrogen fixation protein NifB